MANSKIILTFRVDLVENRQVSFQSDNGTQALNNDFIWKPIRASVGQVTIGPATLTAGERSAINFIQAFNLDRNYNNTNFIVTRFLNLVTIEAKASNIVFTNFQSIEDGTQFPFVDSLNVGAQITNNSKPVFKVDSIIFSESDIDPCLNVKAVITTSALATKINSPVVIIGNTNNPLELEVLRSATFNFEAENASGQTIQKSYVTPPLLTPFQIEINVNNSPFGATVIIKKIELFDTNQDLTFEYSLDQINWQESNQFIGLSVGDYTAYIKDNFGCAISKDFNVDEFGIQNPYFYISKSNSLRFANRITFGDSENYKNDENTLSCEVDVAMPYQEIQRFQSADVITTQFRSNYASNVAKILIEGVVPIPTDASSNDLIYSEDLSNAVWEKDKIDLSGKKIITTTGNGLHRIYQSIVKEPIAGDYTFSFFVKPDELSRIKIYIDDENSIASVFSNYDALNQQIFPGIGTNGFTIVSSTFSIESNGYARVNLKAMLNDSENIRVRVDLYSIDNLMSYTGDGISGLFIDKFQFQKGNLTDYLKTISKPETSEASDGIPTVTIVKKTNNIGIKDKRDARRYSIGGTKLGMYFVSGNSYNYDTNSIIEPYSLNGLLPEWAQIGNYFSIGSAFYLIEDIIFDEAKDADVIVYSTGYVFLPFEDNVIVGSVYNRFNYEVFEFSIDMVDYIDQKFRVKLVNSNPSFPTISHLSELIYCKVKHADLLEIRYRNSTNTDIMYSTGIEHKIRIPYTKVSGKSDEESEIHKTDTDAILLNADLYEVDEFEFEPITKEMWRKVAIALSHEKVLIDGVGYVKNNSFETEGPLDDTNLYVLKANMIKTGSVYNSQTSGNVDFDGTAVEVPGLISTENGFVRY